MKQRTLFFYILIFICTQNLLTGTENPFLSKEVDVVTKRVSLKLKDALNSAKASSDIPDYLEIRISVPTGTKEQKLPIILITNEGEKISCRLVSLIAIGKPEVIKVEQSSDFYKTYVKEGKDKYINLNYLAKIEINRKEIVGCTIAVKNPYYPQNSMTWKYRPKK